MALINKICDRQCVQDMIAEEVGKLPKYDSQFNEISTNMDELESSIGAILPAPLYDDKFKKIDKNLSKLRKSVNTNMNTVKSNQEKTFQYLYTDLMGEYPASYGIVQT